MKTRRCSTILFYFLLICCLAAAIPSQAMCADETISLDDAIEAYKNGRIEEALQKSIILSEKYDDPGIAGMASFIAGYIMRKIMLDGGEIYLEKAYSLYPLIGDYALFTLAGLYEERGEHEKAADLYIEVYKSYPQGVLQKKTLLKAADSYLASGNLQEARNVYEKYMSSYPKDESIPFAIYGIGESYLEEGEILPSFDYFRRIWIDYPASRAAASVNEKMKQLRQKHPDLPSLVPMDFYSRGERLFEAGLYIDAMKELKGFLSSGPSIPGDKKIEAYFMIAMSSCHLRKLEEAEKDLKSFLAKYPDHHKAAEAQYWLGRTYLRAGKEDAFIQSSENYLKKYKNKDNRPEVIYRLGFIHAGRGDTNKALSYYDLGIKKYPQSRYASDSQWAKGWLMYKKGELKKAVHVFDEVLDKKEYSPYTPQAYYWKAKALKRMGDDEGMEKNLCQLCNKERGSFYCLFAMYNHNMACISPATAASPEMEESIISNDGSYSADGLEIEQDVRIKLLLYLGLHEEAVDEVNLLRHRLSKDKKRSISLATVLASMDEYYMALKIIYANYSRDSLYSGRVIDDRVWKLMYPAGYRDIIHMNAMENDVDPRLLYALIREESHFNRIAVSSAGAMGLMQLMPQTAANVKGGPVDRDMLFDPETNISIGTRYFSGLLRQYEGNIIAAVAGYNAGPAAVSRWISEREGFDLDEFIEDIPYRETRNYVKKVFTSYSEYLRMEESVPIIPASPAAGNYKDKSG